ncbi:keratin, type I cytoskeletal 18-like [Desmodus rotundus]|uniref:keratin, type I cytoskeletal 18-like n=1 Tax=Desmodus rotundus TaxID=9430 RepID=UPI0039E250A9
MPLPVLGNHQLSGRPVLPAKSPSYRVWPTSSAASVYAGTGAQAPRSPWPAPPAWGSGGLAAGMAGGLVGIRGIQSEKETMQCLNDHLASYLERVRSLEADNQRLKRKIWEQRRRDPRSETWGHYFKIIEDLRAQIFANSLDNACIVLQMENAPLVANDLRVKYEAELAMRQSVENDINGLQKVIDDTNITQLQLETEIEALKEELLFMKNHEEEESEGQLGEQPGDTLCHTDGTAQWDPAAPGVRLAQTRAEGQHQAQECEALLNIKVKLEAEIATYCSLLEEGEDFNLVDALDKNPSLQIIKDHNLQDCGRQSGWCLKPMTPCVIEALKAAEVGHLGGGRRPIKSSEFI